MTRIRETAVDTRDDPGVRLRHVGASALSTRELLTLILGNEEPAYLAVVESKGSLRSLAGMSLPQLEALPFVGPVTAARLAATFELGRRMASEGAKELERIGGPRDVYDMLAPEMRDLDHEEFRVLLLDVQHAVKRVVTVTRGVLDGSLVHPREIFRAAITEATAAVILVHNHPSGDPTPSAEDRQVTRQLREAGQVLGIPVLDHVVIGDGRFCSFVEAGLMMAGDHA